MSQTNKSDGRDNNFGELHFICYSNRVDEYSYLIEGLDRTREREGVSGPIARLFMLYIPLQLAPFLPPKRLDLQKMTKGAITN